MNYELLCQGDSRLLRVKSEKANEIIKVEAGSMVGMTPNFKNKTTTGGGVLKMLGRSLNGESAIIQEYTSQGEGEILIAPTWSGDIIAIEMNGNTSYKLGTGAFLACTKDVNLDTKANKLKGLIGTSEGLLSVVASGHGTLFINSCGSTHEINLADGEEYIVDSGHLIIWDSALKVETKFAGLLNSEGFVSKFTGPGKIIIQSRKPILIPSN